jgi:hypothetical protein
MNETFARDTRVRAAAGQVELALAAYGRGRSARAMTQAFMLLIRTLLPNAGDEAVEAIVTLCVLEAARERLQAGCEPARVVAIGGSEG